MTALTDALEDLVREMRGGADISIAAEIAGEYGLNPSLLVRKLHEAYPSGLPTIDMEAAIAGVKALEGHETELARREYEAMREFFSDPTKRVGLEPLLRKFGL